MYIGPKILANAVFYSEDNIFQNRGLFLSYVQIEVG